MQIHVSITIYLRIKTNKNFVKTRNVFLIYSDSYTNGNKYSMQTTFLFIREDIRSNQFHSQYPLSGPAYTDMEKTGAILCKYTVPHRKC